MALKEVLILTGRVEHRADQALMGLVKLQGRLNILKTGIL